MSNYFMKPFHEKGTILRKKVLEDKLIMMEYKGWKISYPYPINHYSGFMIYKDKQKISVIVGESYPVISDTLLFESGCCYNRFNTLDEILDHIDKTGKCENQ